MAPPRVIDYVVVHELVHLAEKNHSGRFWDRVAIIQPDYKESRGWLKENGHLLEEGRSYSLALRLGSERLNLSR